MEAIPKYILLTIIFLSGIISVHYGILGFNEIEVSSRMELLWSLIFTALIGSWCQKDKGGKSFEKPFEFGFLVFLLWPILLPYYLVKTRGYEGILMFIGLFALYCLPPVIWLISWSYA